MKTGKSPRSKLPLSGTDGGPAAPQTEEEIVFFDLDQLGLDEETEEGWLDLAQFEPAQETLQEVAEQTTYGAVFLNDLIRRQRALSLSVAIVFLVIIFSFPLLTFFLRSLTAFEILGFEVSWLALGILIYPLIWALAFYFVSTAEKYEEDFIRLVK